ncbi:gamma-aminobutyric acid type B receptor subunit 2 [Euwallacea fornicatus]|uniref:gamma-aminobutyric acid type B receptor subunit 2 n=1 Tax=Euwallacea fornicatus TaxID=995702 RepID=UPI00338FB619
MSIMHPLQRSFCILFISLAFIFFIIHLRKNRKQSFFPNVNSSPSLYDGLFAGFNDVGNSSETNPREIIFDVVKLLKTSFFELNDNKSRTFHGDGGSERIYVLGLFDLTSKHGEQKDGASEFMAAKLAVRHINALKILPGDELVLLVNDTQCDPGVAIDRLFHAIYSEHKIMMLLGSGCSNVSEALAHIVPYWNIIQISYGSRSPVLSDRRQFPLFFRTVAPDSSHNIAKSNFIKHYKWKVVVAFSQSENQYLLPINHLITELEKDNITCMSTVTFSHDNYKEQLEVLKHLDIRIIIGSFSPALAPLIFCTAYSLGMLGNEYVWILERFNVTPWEDKANCSQHQMLAATEGIIMVEDFDHNDALEDADAPDLQKLIGQMTLTAKCSYDAIWTMALAIKASNVGSLQSFDYLRSDITCSLFELISKLAFVGLSGALKFEGADRLGDLVISQLQGGKLKKVALYDSVENNLSFNCPFCLPISWISGRAPLAQRIVKTSLVTIPRSLFYAVTGISCMGICCSVVFLYFNLKFRHIKTIKLSSPNLNNLTVTGCIFVYVSVIIFGLHRIADAASYFEELCFARIYFLSAGFSLTFGSMFAKSYRVYRLFTYSLIPVLKNKLLKDQQLIGLILIPLFIDSVTIALWKAVDPLRRHMHDLTLEVGKEDPRIVYQLQIELCQCNNTTGWHVALFGYKSIILIMGVYMAWKTRHVKVPALNDSQYVGICVYSAVFSTILVIAFSFVTEYFILSFIVKTTSILASATITLALMSFPKLKSLLSGKGLNTEIAVIESMGLKLESNTRRFIFDDPKEMVSRLEIQNKVFRCELESLDREIARLEGLLEGSNSSSNKSSSNVQVFPEIHYLDVPRASWPMWQNQSIKAFSSDNKLNKAKSVEKGNFLGKLKKFFGSLASLHYDLDQKQLSSNPEMSDRAFLPCNDDMNKSDSHIQGRPF